MDRADCPWFSTVRQWLLDPLPYHWPQPLTQLCEKEAASPSTWEKWGERMFGLRLRRYRVTQSLKCICHAGLEARRTAMKRSGGSSRAIANAMIWSLTLGSPSQRAELWQFGYYQSYRFPLLAWPYVMYTKPEIWFRLCANNNIQTSLTQRETTWYQGVKNALNTIC